MNQELTQTPAPTTAEALLNETRNFYYGPNWEDLGRRSTSEGAYYYKKGNLHCAIGILNPGAPWGQAGLSKTIQGYGEKNEEIFLAELSIRGITGDISLLLNFGRHMQRMHDDTSVASSYYASALELARQIDAEIAAKKDASQ